MASCCCIWSFLLSLIIQNNTLVFCGGLCSFYKEIYEGICSRHYDRRFLEKYICALQLMFSSPNGLGYEKTDSFWYKKAELSELLPICNKLCHGFI